MRQVVQLAVVFGPVPAIASFREEFGIVGGGIVDGVEKVFQVVESDHAHLVLFLFLPRKAQWEEKQDGKGGTNVLFHWFCCWLTIRAWFAEPSARVKSTDFASYTEICRHEYFVAVSGFSIFCNFAPFPAKGKIFVKEKNTEI